jgi:fructokinase
MSSRQTGAMRCVGTGFIALDVIRSTSDQGVILERRHAGGSCGNVLAILSYMGIGATAVGRIGHDRAGDELVADLRRSSVDLRFLNVEKDRRTPVVIQEVVIDSRGRRRHRFSRECPVCGAAMPTYRPLLVTEVAGIAPELPPHQFFFFDRVAPGPLELAQKSRQQGALVIFEPSGIRDDRLFVECLKVAHIFKYSRERLTDLDAFVTTAPVPLEIETLGLEGLRFRLRRLGRLGAWHHLPAIPSVSFRDSAGSGDWCTAGVMARLATSGDPLGQLLESDSLIDALRFGQALAALNCSYDGARGLMYAMGRAATLRVAERLAGDGLARLPQERAPRSPTRRSTRACVVCASDLQAAHA